jgi:hypothetical protein
VIAVQKRVRGRYAVAVVLVALFAAVFAAGFVLARVTTDAPPTPGVAPASTTAMLDAYVAAMNRGDADEIGSFYAEDAVLEEHDRSPAVVTESRDAIAAHLSAYRFLDYGDLTATGVAVSHGAFVAQPMQWSRSERGIQVFELADDGLILRQWTLGPLIAFWR